MATKYKRPEHFEVLKKRSKCMKFIEDDKNKVLMIEMLSKMTEDSAIAVYSDRCKAIVETVSLDVFFAAPPEPWSTIIHTDFWVNNIMFHRHKDGRVDDVKFVDFQNYMFLSPLRDLIFYLFSSTNDEVQDNHIEELIDLYHETLLAVLEHMGCDTRPFARNEFDAKLPSDVRLEFMHLCFMLKILTLDAQATQFDKIENVMMSYEGSQALFQRLRKIVLYFVKRNWI